jgi:hypothetical protein
MNKTEFLKRLALLSISGGLIPQLFASPVFTGKPAIWEFRRTG